MSADVPGVTTARAVATDRPTPLLEVRGLTKLYPIRQGYLRKITGYVRAVDGISFEVQGGETLALVGESGCGKSTVARTVLRAVSPTAGTIMLHTGSATVDLATVEGDELRRVRRHMQMIFQDPYSSLNPRQRVRDIIAEPMRLNGVDGGTAKARVDELLSEVGLRPEHAIRYPHAFSGGQRQRIGIARAVSLRPRLIVCDEPVSALDVSVQAQILNLLKDLQDTFALTYLFISHDLGVVQHTSDRVAVMYLGQLVEIAPTAALFERPQHPYTQALLLASPKPHPRYRGQIRAIRGEVPDAADPPTGCRFRTRCPHAQQICADEQPALRQIPDERGPRLAACHFADELGLTGLQRETPTEITSTPKESR